MLADGIVFAGSDDEKLYALPEDDPDSNGVITDSEALWNFTAGKCSVSWGPTAPARVLLLA